MSTTNTSLMDTQDHIPIQPQDHHGSPSAHEGSASSLQSLAPHDTDTTVALLGAHKAALKPKIFVSGSTALLWDVEAVSFLRKTQRIIGSLAGSLPRSPLQNIFQGLPLRLLPEEAHVLWDHGLIELIDDSNAYRTPTAEEIADPGVATGAISILSADQRSRTSSSSSSSDKKNNAKANFEYITLHTLSSYLPWFSTATKKEKDFPQIPIPSPVKVSPPSFWKYPSTLQEWNRCVIFKHLWEQCQYFVAPGMKFGGDYLLYEKDPLICHSSRIASVRDMDEPLSMTDLANYARLASSVQKRHLLCSVVKEKIPDTDTEPSSYQQRPLDNTTSSTLPLTQTKPKVMIIAVEWAGF
ncbi:tRNA-splicing endonuclease subunit [Podila humilis]|nr:tRNA-splicing endonuclease subunit [Podila humilis]